MRQRWLLGLRRLAQAEPDSGRAVELWESIHQAEPLDQEATAWLVEHYRRQGNRSSLRITLQRRHDAETEMKAL